MDSSTLTILSQVELAALVGFTVQLLKGYIGIVLKPTNPLYDNTIRLFSIALGVAALAMNLNFIPTSGPLVLSLIYHGGLIGTGAVLGYHGVTDILPRVLSNVQTTASAKVLVPGDPAVWSAGLQAVELKPVVVGNTPAPAEPVVPLVYTPKVDPSLATVEGRITHPPV